MKSIITEKVSMKSFSYPCLGKYISKVPRGSFVVLFRKPNMGTVIYTEDASLTWPIGTYSEEWGNGLF